MEHIDGMLQVTNKKRKKQKQPKEKPMKEAVKFSSSF